MAHIDDGRVVHVRLLAEPCLWLWEIRDGVDGRLVESSWANEWVGFASRMDAAAAGARRLGELRATGFAGRAAASGRTTQVAEPSRRA
jgi:hypothetical protein